MELNHVSAVTHVIQVVVPGLTEAKLLDMREHNTQSWKADVLFLAGKAL